MSTIKKNCLNCETEFNAPVREVNRGNGKFCTRTCSAIYAKKQIPKPEPNVSCAQCKLEFYKNASKRTNSKSGLYFCSRKCKDTAQCLGGIKEIMPAHYGLADGKYTYRELAFRHKAKKCERCGYDENEAGIVVHHMDHNRSNNDISNLEVLCGTCHAIEHWSK